MPTYEYRCPEGHEFELFQKMSEKPRAKCPVCGKPATRKISGGAGLVFKGTGFYITDYGKDGKGPAQGPGEVDSARRRNRSRSSEVQSLRAPKVGGQARPQGRSQVRPSSRPANGKGKAASE